MPRETRLVVYEFSWEDYELLLEKLVERRGLRVSYDCGRLEIMTTSMRHERYGRLFDRLVGVFAEARNLAVEMCGQTTWDEIDPESDARPDIAVEIDLTSSSLRKLSIYAALGVQEIWRYDNKTVQIYSRRDSDYVGAEASRFLPGLTGTMLTEALEVCKTHGQTEALRSFRRRIQM